MNHVLLQRLTESRAVLEGLVNEESKIIAKRAKALLALLDGEEAPYTVQALLRIAYNCCSCNVRAGCSLQC